MPEPRPFIVETAEQLWAPRSRRNFLKTLGIGGTVVLLPSVFAACHSDSDNVTGVTVGSATLDLSTDAGILNYAYALEQLEAGFYLAVCTSSSFSSYTAEQQEVFLDLRNHEVIHREFLKAALGSSAIGSLSLNANTMATATASITAVLHNAEAFEDLGVAAYNGAGKYLTDANNLGYAGKIVSVEARHAAAIRDMRDAAGITTGAAAGTRFAGDDVVASTGTYAGLDVKLEPSAVLSRVAASTFVSTTVTVSKSPATLTGTPDAGPPSPTP